MDEKTSSGEHHNMAEGAKDMNSEIKLDGSDLRNEVDRKKLNNSDIAVKTDDVKESENISVKTKDEKHENNVHENQENDNNQDEEDEEMQNEVIFTNKYDGKTSQIPDFSVVYSFLEMFGVFLDLPYVTINDLEQSIDCTKDLAKKDDQGILEILHIKLFRRLNKSSRFSTLSSCQADRLPKIILKFAQLLDLSCAWDLEQFGYHILSSTQKLMILKNLCEVQFDENVKFRTNIQEAFKLDPASSLRLLPFGYEQDGLHVWFHEDKEFDVRIYAGEEDDASGESWKIRAGNLDDLDVYISQLKNQAEVNPKDVAAEKIKERQVKKQEERDRRRNERELRRQEREKQQKENEKEMKVKGRGKRAKPKKEEIVASEDSSSEEEDDGCARCYENKQSDLVLLCDGCDAAYHTLCLRPPVMVIPDGDWYCPFCQQVKLIEKLQGKLVELRSKLRARERKSKRLDFYGIRAANILDAANDDGLGRRRTAKKVDYNFSDYDHMISEAVSTYKKIDKVRENRDSDIDLATRRSKRAPGRKKKLNDLNSDEEEYSSGSNFELSDSDIDRRNDMKDFLVDDDYDEIEERHRNKYLRRSERNRDKNPRGVRRRYNDGDRESDNKNVLSDSSDGFGPRRSRRNTRLRNVAKYTDSYSDDSDHIERKNSNDVDEWKNENGEEEELELSECDSVVSDNLNSAKKVPILKKLKARKKRKVIDSDSDESELPYDDESDEKEEEEKVEEDEEEEDEEEEDGVDEDDEDEDEGEEGQKVREEVNRVNESSNNESEASKAKESATNKDDQPSTSAPQVITAFEENKKDETRVNKKQKMPEHVTLDVKSVSEQVNENSEKKNSAPPTPHTLHNILNNSHNFSPQTSLNNAALMSSSVNNIANRNTGNEYSHQQPRIELPSTQQSYSPWNETPSLNPTQYSSSQPVMPHPAMHSPTFRYSATDFYPNSSHHQYRNQSSQGDLPMRPTPTYPYPTSEDHSRHPNATGQHFSPQSYSAQPYSHPPQSWPGMKYPQSCYQQTHHPAALPASKFYGSQSNWMPHQRGQREWQHQPETIVNAMNSHQYLMEREKTHKRQMKEQAKIEREMKKMQKQREKEDRKRPASPPVYHEPKAAKNIGYFKNMVISSDGANNKQSASDFQPFSQPRF